MAMDKRWQQTFDRLDAIEITLGNIEVAIDLEAVISRLDEWELEAESEPAVTKEQLMEIKGVGEATAVEILNLLYGDEGE